MTLEDLLPHWHYRERHGVATRASPSALLTGVREFTWKEVPIFQFLATVASRGRRRLPQDVPVLTAMTSRGGFVCLHETGEEIVYGAVVRIGPPGRSVALDAPVDEAFRAFDEPGCYKVAFNFRCNAGRLTTETRVLCTDRATRRRFRRYWLVIRLPSGLMRREWLHAIRRLALRG
jgi:hypothetical protein